MHGRPFKVISPFGAFPPYELAAPLKRRGLFLRLRRMATLSGRAKTLARIRRQSGARGDRLVKLMSWIGLAAAVVVLAACSKPAQAPAAPPASSVERTGSVGWNATTGGFELNGRPLKTAKLWTFDGSTDGFTAVRSKVEPAAGAGLAVTIVDPSLRSPRGLSIPGAQYPMVVVRLTRTKAGEAWDGALYYATAAHPESAGFLGKPTDPAQPGVNETVTLVYDMSRQANGAGDWLASTIDQIRLDIEDKPGGQFVIHQIAIAEHPEAAPPPKAEPAPKASPPAATPPAKP